MASVTYGKCYLWQKYYVKCNYGKNIMANETEPHNHFPPQSLSPTILLVYRNSSSYLRNLVLVKNSGFLISIFCNQCRRPEMEFKEFKPRFKSAQIRQIPV